MTVAELIADLSKLDQDAMVVVAGYEGGVEEAEGARLCPCEVALDVNAGSAVYGEHEIPNAFLISQHGGRAEFERKFRIVKGVFIG